MVLRNWGILGVAAAMMVVGCAGSGGGSTTGTGTGLVVASATVNLPDRPGLLQIGFLTGSGRARSSALVAIVRNLEFDDAYGRVFTPLDPEIALPLSDYPFQTKNFNVPFTTAQGLSSSVSTRLNNRLFETLPLDFLKFQYNGGDVATPAIFPLNVSARVLSMPGRTSLVPLYLDDTIFTVDASNNVVFNATRFSDVNQPSGKPIKSFFNDYVSFDLSGLPAAARPTMSNGSLAGRLYFSGDNYAVSDAGTSGYFEALTLDPATPIVGAFGPPGTISGVTGAAGHAGTFTVTQPNPSNPDPTVTMTIVALQGTWQDYTSVFNNISNFEVLTFPNSNDDKFQELVVVHSTGGVVDNLYFGYADLDAGQLHAWPIKNIVTADTSNEITGTVSGFLNSNLVSTASIQAARFGTYTFNGTLPSGWKSTGRFTVFRR